MSRPVLRPVSRPNKLSQPVSRPSSMSRPVSRPVSRPSSMSRPVSGPESFVVTRNAEKPKKRPKIDILT